MSAATAPPLGPYVSAEVTDWRRIRRYAVPRPMIELATERRLAGDWRGTCAAANVDVGFDLVDVAHEYGTKIAAALAEDLHYLAPDLVRWHLPRVLGGRTTLATFRRVLLAGYGPPERPGAPTGPFLQVRPPTVLDGPQRLGLMFGPAPAEDQKKTSWLGLRQLWDVRHADELRQHCGGGERVPFFHADGTPLTAPELPDDTGPGYGDVAARTERFILLRESGRVAEAFAAAGIDLDLSVPWRNSRVDVEELIARTPLDPGRLGPAMVRYANEVGTGTAWIEHYYFRPLCLAMDGDLLRVRYTERRTTQDRVLPEAYWRWPPDLDLLRTGRIGPDELHPLVRAALFPARTATGGPIGPPDPARPESVPVRCRGEWHQVRLRGDGLEIPHDAAEQQRERALRAFGGKIAGCFAVRQAWADSSGWLPRRLRDQRKEFFNLMQHGDTRNVLRMLDAGFDPRVRNGREQTLLHLLHLVDHEELLPRLLAAGLDLEAGDHRDRTPLFVAVAEWGSPALVDALIEAGAEVDTGDYADVSVYDLVCKQKRRELTTLVKLFGLENHDWDAERKKRW